MDDIKALIKEAKECKHGDAVLLLHEAKPKIQGEFAKVYSSVMDADDRTNQATKDKISNVVALVAEYVFQKCVQTLLDDKK